MKPAFALLVWLSTSSVFAADDQKLLYDTHRWLELRDAIEKQDASPLYRGMAASAFNNLPEAERELRKATGSPAPVEVVVAAHQALAILYWRVGRYRDALASIDQLLKQHPEQSDARNMRPLLETLSRRPVQVVERRRPSRIHYELKGGNLIVPASINGKPVYYILDTGFTTCSLSQSEARRVGLTTGDVSVKAGGSMLSSSVGMQAATASHLGIGDFQFRDVACTVLPDSSQPFADLPPGEQGIIGLPVILAFDTLRWSAGGTMEIGFASTPRGSESPLWLDGLQLMTRAAFGRDSLDLHVDTGSTDTYFLPRFRKDFANLVDEQGKKSSETITQVSGSKEIESLILPEVVFRIGSFDAALRPCPVLQQSKGLAWAHGLLGMDILGKARTVSLDFSRMALSME